MRIFVVLSSVRKFSITLPHPQCGAHYTTRTMRRRRVDTTRAAQRRKFERRRRAAPDKSENSCNHSLEFETIKIRRDCTRPPVVTFDVLSSFSLAFQTKRRAGAEIPISAPLGEYVWPRNEMTIDRERRGGRGGGCGRNRLVGKASSLFFRAFSVFISHTCFGGLHSAFGCTFPACARSDERNARREERQAL